MAFHYIFIISFIVSGINSSVWKSGKSFPARHKRYIAFPEGSSLSVAVCFTANSFINIHSPFEITEGVNWGVAYDLPNASSIIDTKNTFKHVQQRSLRSSIYEKLETILNYIGITGHECILRAICETEKRSSPTGNTIIDELLNILFRFPLRKIEQSEPEIHRFYHRARRMARTMSSCESLFPVCKLSLTDMVFYHA